MPSVGADGPIKSPRSVGSRSSRPQQHHRKVNPASANQTVASGHTHTTAPSKGPTSTHTAFALPQGVYIPSLIDKDDSITNDTKPYRMPKSNTVYDHETNKWVATSMPKDVPDKREDVRFLEMWLTERLADLAVIHPANTRPSDKFSSGAAEVAQQQLAVLDKGYFELVRQVGVQCSDRAELMLRIWRAGHELFENVIRDLATTVTEMRHNAETWKEKYDQLQKDMDILMWKHARELEAAVGESKTHKSEDSSVYRDMQDELFMREKDMNMMEAALSDLSIWFPNFDKYASSNLRKQLPVAIEPESVKPLLPQEYFMKDMERAGHIMETVLDKKISKPKEDGASDKSNELSVEEQSKADNRLRELVVDNQIQEMVLKESENKMKRMEAMETVYKKRIEELMRENNFLQHKVAEGECTTNLQSIPSFLKGPNTVSVASEMADFYVNKRSSDTSVSVVPPNVVSVGDLQATLHKCCSDFLSNKLTLNWHVHKGSTNERGLNVISGSSYWRLTGTMGGVTGPEMRINTFESLLSYYVLHRTRSKRLARESLRKATWSILLWKNKMGIAVEAKPAEEKSIFNHTHSQTFTLPRQLSENEKPFMLCMSHLFGYFRIKPDNPELVQSLYFNVFMRAFSTLQRYLCSPEASASILASSSNLFVPAAPSLIAVEKTTLLVQRLFGTPQQSTAKLYRPVVERRYSRAVSLSVTEKLDIFGGKKTAQMNRTWWTCLPNNILLKIAADITLHSQKYSSALVEAYDIIEIIWKHVYEYYTSVRAILENLYVFLEAITSGPLDPMYTTLLLSFLETKDSNLSVEHKVLSIEFISLNSQGLLTPVTFADTILSKPNIYLTGLHLLFDENIRLVRELRREGLELLDDFKANYIKYEMDEDLTHEPNSRHSSMILEEDTYLARNVKRLTIIGRRNDEDFANFPVMPSLPEESSGLEESSSYFSNSLVEDNHSIDSGGKQFDVLLSYAMYCFDEDSLEAKDDTGIPYYLKSFDIYCAFVAMKCVSDLNAITRTICPVVDIDRVASAIRHREVHLARVTFLAWFDYIERRKNRVEEDSDNSDDDQDDDDFTPGSRGRSEDEDDGNGKKENNAVKSSKVVVPVRRPARGMRAFTSKVSSIDEEEDD